MTHSRLNLSIILLAVAIFTQVCFPQTLTGQSYQNNLSSYGLALPKDNITLRSNIDSHVQSILVSEGQQVKRGDVLIELENKAAAAKHQIAKLAAEELGASLAAKAELKFAKSNFEKVKSLFEKKAINEKEFQETRLRLENAEARLQIAMEAHNSNLAKLSLAEAELEDHFIRAPFDGQVVDLYVSPGSAISSDTDILKVVSSDVLRVDLHLTVEESDDLVVGNTYRLKIQEPFRGRLLDGKLVFLSPMIEATTNARRVTLEIDNCQSRLPAGFTVIFDDDPFVAVQ